MHKIFNKIMLLSLNSWINYVIIAYAFSIPVSRGGISILTTLMIILWLFEANYKEKFNFLKQIDFIKIFFLFIAFSYLSLLWTNSMYLGDGISYVNKYVRLIFLPMLVIVTSLNKENIPKLFIAFLTGMLISEVISYGIFFELWNFKDIPANDPTPFMHHLDYSTFLAFTSLLLLNKVFSQQNIKYKVFYIVYFLLTTSNLFINGGRTGQMAFIFALIAVGFLNMKNKLLAISSMTLLFLAIFYTAYNLIPTSKIRFDQASNEIYKFINQEENKYQGSFGLRVAVWTVGAKMIQDNPVLGTGAGAEMPMMRQYAVNMEDKNLSVAQEQVHFHNQFVHIAVQLGIVGFVLYLLMWYSLFNIKVRDDYLNKLKVIFIVVFCTASLVENIFHNQFPMSLFALFVSIFIISSVNIRAVAFQ